MSGIPDREARLQLTKALLAHGADPNARITRRPPGFAGGYNDAVGATPFLLASSVADIEMMRLLLAAGADPKLVTGSRTNAVMAAGGLGRGTGESPVTEQQAIDAVKLLLELGVDAKAVTAFNENALFGPAYRGWNTLLQLIIDQGADVNVVSKAGVTPWLAASGFGDRLGGVLYTKEGADLLAKHGADPTLGKPFPGQNERHATDLVAGRPARSLRSRVDSARWRRKPFGASRVTTAETAAQARKAAWGWGTPRPVQRPKPEPQFSGL